MMTKHFLLLLILFSLVIYCDMTNIEQLLESSKLNFKMTLEEREILKNKTKEMFNHAFTNYMREAFPSDELQPLVCTGRNRANSNRGTLDEALGE
jgi:hypothetical protein